MIIIYGDIVNQREGFEMLHNHLIATNNRSRFTLSSSPEYMGDNLPAIVKRIHRPHHNHISLGFHHDLKDPAQIYMVGMGLAAYGSIAVFFGHCTAEEVVAGTFYGLIPAVMCDMMTQSDLEAIVASHAMQQLLVADVSRFNSSGLKSAHGDTIMIVGEGSQDLGDGKRMAFISATGCSLFLHEALRQHPANRYYLTNADKGLTMVENRKALLEEIDRIKPKRIIAMGAPAATMLADLRQKFDRTYHPQYWKRFKSKQFNELVDFLK